MVEKNGYLLRLAPKKTENIKVIDDYQVQQSIIIDTSNPFTIVAEGCLAIGSIIIDKTMKDSKSSVGVGFGGAINTYIVERSSNFNLDVSKGQNITFTVNGTGQATINIQIAGKKVLPEEVTR